MTELDAYKEYLREVGGENLSDEEVLESYKRAKEDFNRDVESKASEYEKLDMDKFIDRIGGQGAIDRMRSINEAAAKIKVLNGHAVVDDKTDSTRDDVHKSDEDSADERWKEEWKKGFMEGVEEAYKMFTRK